MTCPTPNKHAYRSHRKALHDALATSAKYGHPMRIYRCPCGALHLTKRPQQQKAN